MRNGVFELGFFLLQSVHDVLLIGINVPFFEFSHCGLLLVCVLWVESCLSGEIVHWHTRKEVYGRQSDQWSVISDQ